MTRFLKTVSKVLIVLGGVVASGAIVILVVAVLSDRPANALEQAAPVLAVFASGIATILGAGVVYLLTVIADNTDQQIGEDDTDQLVRE